MSDSMHEKRRTPWGFWMGAILLLVLVVYPLSWGVECFLVELYPGDLPEWVVWADLICYFPLHWIDGYGPEWVAGPLHAYQTWWVRLANPNVEY